jgi:hypothetical protein
LALQRTSQVRFRSQFLRLASGAFYKTIVPAAFCEIINLLKEEEEKLWQ